MSSLTVTKLLHVNQLVDDFDAARAFYARVFGAREYWTGYDEAENRDASLFVIGDTCIELFAPRDRTSLLGASLARFGNSWHSFEWQVPDLEQARRPGGARGADPHLPPGVVPDDPPGRLPRHADRAVPAGDDRGPPHRAGLERHRLAGRTPGRHRRAPGDVVRRPGRRHGRGVAERPGRDGGPPPRAAAGARRRGGNGPGGGHRRRVGAAALGGRPGRGPPLPVRPAAALDRVHGRRRRADRRTPAVLRAAGRRGEPAGCDRRGRGRQLGCAVGVRGVLGLSTLFPVIGATLLGVATRPRP